jgi:HSP20 family protein
MSYITRWEPFRGMRRLHDTLDRLMDESLQAESAMDMREGFAPLDVYQTDDELVVEALMPGVKPDNLDVSITGDTLSIRGEVREEREVSDDSKRDYLVRERRYQRYSRTLRLPTLVQADKAEAEFDNGVLRLKLPKAEEVKPKTIKIKAK